MTITVNDVINAVSGQLAEHFPNMPRYGEEIKQGLNAPCFFIKLLSGSQTREVGRRYYRTQMMDIHYFPNPAKDQNEDAWDMAERLNDILEYIPFGSGVFRGSRMRGEIVDGVLHFFVNYDFHVMRPKPETPTIQSIKQEVRLK